MGGLKVRPTTPIPYSPFLIPYFRNFAFVRTPKSVFIHILVLAIIGVHLFSFEYLPLQDYPDWLYQGHLFNQYFFHGNDFGGYFTFHGYIPPNGASTIGIGLLSLIVNPFIAGKLFLFVALALMYFGCDQYLQHFARTKHITNTFVALYFVFNLHFLIGNISFLFGLGFALSSFCYLYKRSRLECSYYQIPFILICYLSHFFALAIFLLLIAVYTNKEQRKLTYRNVILSSLPTAMIFIHYWMNKTITTFNPENLDSTPLQMFMAKLTVVSVTSIPFHRYKAVWEPTDLIKYINYSVAAVAVVALIAAIVIIVWKRNWSRESIIVTLIFILLVTLPYEIAGLYFPAERFMILLFLAMIVFFSGQLSVVSGQLVRRGIFVIFTGLTLLSLWYNYMMFGNYNTMLSKSNIPDQKILGEYSNREGTDPFTRLNYYDAITKMQPMPIFTTALFTYRGANPNSFDGK